ncbi:two-component system LytT family response regulator/two-component system response regulator LytT [Sporomusaceae bacterium BoRhaA]|uniref:LytR/AlgR family response regulator transcription factor n=1 Tax=Pelorhabdus rhamnosifermentans TaxID=2772457 RepID=UPI001C060307|nr:LytTR family DNA-binding domain-containing protein [Pelorhabdus rhamnosifermentans]MBU2702525.1 two-component system LytT family response regulator/two-component system response regulator LytT [Pelorhabdus rhamnosifermentans]
MLKALVVDDEKPARDELSYLLSLESALEVVGQADSGAAAITLAAKLKPNVIFMDIEMRGVTGLEAASVLRSLLPDVIIIFSTAYDHYAIKAFEIGAVDYILKPFEGQRVHTAVERLKNYPAVHWQAAAQRMDEVFRQTKTVVTKLPVDKNGKIVLVSYDDIVYVTIKRGTVLVITHQDEYQYHGTLAELEERTRQTSLTRVHKSYLVNLDKVSEVIPWFKGTYWLKVDHPLHTEIPVSKNQIKEIKSLLGLK